VFKYSVGAAPHGWIVISNCLLNDMMMVVKSRDASPRAISEQSPFFLQLIVAILLESLNESFLE
jgi:hypothetical protein